MGRRRGRSDERFYEQLVESAPDAILVVDDAGRIVYANRRCEALAGWDRTNLLGRDIEVLVPGAARGAHPAHRRAYLTDAHARPMGAGLDLHLATADGRQVPVDISLSPLTLSGRSAVAVAVRDISDRRRTELELRRAREELERTVEELQRSTALLTTANELGDLLHSCRTVDDAYDVLVRYGDAYFPGSSGAIYRSGAGGRELELVRHWGNPDPFDRLFASDACWAFRRGRQHVRHVEADLPCGHLDPRCQSACTPLLAQGEVLGLLVVCAGAQSDATDDLEPRARSLGEHLSLALANIVLREHLRSQSIRDPLTGLYNRRYLDEHLQRELHRSDRSGAPIGIVSIDLDHFKAYNDAFGHGAGDTALVSIASMLRLRCRDEDVVCRLGGEEFLVVLPGATLADTMTRGEELRAACADLPFGSGRSLTMSVGVAAYPTHGASIDDVLAAVDTALYAAKRDGRNRVAVAPAQGGTRGPA